jgi:hypothetical protein
MQTFMPYSSFNETAKALDYRRLGKQRVEAKQILQVLTEGATGWASHPIVEAWRGYEEGLSVYGLYICSEWRMRGYKDSLHGWFQAKRLILRDGRRHMTEFPAWVKDPEVNHAYQQVLVWKEPEHYEEVFDMVQLREPTFPWELLKRKTD